MLPPQRRLPDLARLVEERSYFVLHAARQTGKTTAMRAFAESLRARGVVAVWATLEESQGAEAVGEAEPIWLRAIHRGACFALPEAERPPDPAAWLAEEPGTRLSRWLGAWCAALPGRTVALLLDEADVVGGLALISLLRQLRAGFMDRGPGRFPSAVGLIGMRDLRDTLAESKDGSPLNPGSPFNIKATRLTLRDFQPGEVAELLGQHTQETGQRFEPEAVDRVVYWTCGQPYLVNALASIAVTELVPDPARPVGAEVVEAARERLIASRATHLDSLAVRLRDPRVAPVVAAVVTGDIPRSIDYTHDDFQYVLDLGLIRLGPEGAEPANPLYREILARQITHNLQTALPTPRWRWRTPAGRLDMSALVEQFLAWWREDADALTEDRPQYPEAVPHIAFMAFLQKVVNGGGQVTREYAAGRGAVDLVVTYGGERHVVELKRVRPRDRLESVREAGVEQLLRYLRTLGEPRGWLVVFDQRPERPWAERLWAEDRVVEGHTLHLRGA